MFKKKKNKITIIKEFCNTKWGGIFFSIFQLKKHVSNGGGCYCCCCVPVISKSWHVDKGVKKKKKKIEHAVSAGVVALFFECADTMGRITSEN